MPIAKPLPATRVLACLLVLCALVAAPAAALAQSDEIVDKVTKQNKKAVEEYENLNFEEARKILKDALDVCAANGLDKHPITARTHIHLGIVILAGFKQRDNAIKQFRKALEIQPEIKLTKSLANPEIQEAFDEAQAGMGQPEKPDTADGKAEKAKPEKAAAPDKGEKAEKTEDGGDKGATADNIVHDAVTEATQGGAITITAHVDVNLGVTKMVLAYRPDGAKEFLGRVMREVTQGNWTAEIPASATAGNRVAYYLEAQGGEDNTLGRRGTEDDPMMITLKGSGAPVESSDDEGDDEDDGSHPKWFIGLAIGSGTGYVSGSTEENDVSVKGFAPATLGHLAPEIGYFVREHVLLSLQLRLQLVTGNNELHLADTPENRTQCGGDLICSKANGATAALAKVTFLFGEDRFHPYVSIAAGGGQIRHVVTLKNQPPTNTCGAGGNDACVDTALAGPVFFGPGVGFMFNASRNFALTLGAGTLIGVPKFTFNIDFNAGVAAMF